MMHNDALTTVKVCGRELAVGDLREEQELEWDSEEYTDVEAIIIAECVFARAILFRAQFPRNYGPSHRESPLTRRAPRSIAGT